MTKDVANTNTLGRLAAVAVAIAATSVGFAAPASAIVPPADGNYTFSQAGKPNSTWTMQSICSQPSGTRAQQDYTDETTQTLGCSLILGSLASRSGMDRDQRAVSFNGTARLVSGMWTLTVEVPEGLACPDGSFAPSSDTYAFSSATLTGTHTSIHGSVCGLAPGMTKEPFALTFIGPLDPPVVDRFPMDCNYLGGRPSICS
ncbi:MAG: hypothetical protein WBB07_28725 [Mycobacterium sp.]